MGDEGWNSGGVKCDGVKCGVMRGNEGKRSSKSDLK